MINNSTAVFQEEEDALKPLRQKVQAHTGCCPPQITRCDSKDTVTLVNSHFNEITPFFNLLGAVTQIRCWLEKENLNIFGSSQIILQSLVCNYSTTVCQLCNYHCEYANSD